MRYGQIPTEESGARRVENEAKREEATIDRAVNTMITEGASRTALRTGGTPPMPPASSNAEGENFFVFGEALVTEEGQGRPLAPS
ncbi:MAG TPA: hypothetical protein VGB77_22205 [Abditibacteriaceae bacterium]|jgi:hypothetical protein